MCLTHGLPVILRMFPLIDFGLSCVLHLTCAKSLIISHAYAHTDTHTTHTHDTYMYLHNTDRLPVHMIGSIATVSQQHN